jgi:hypothetical protein
MRGNGSSSSIVKRVVEAHRRREPVVTLLEDLHWFDPGSEAFLEVLVETTTTARSLLLVNFRPEYHARWMQRSYYQRPPLAPLSAEAIGGRAQIMISLARIDPEDQASSLFREGREFAARSGDPHVLSRS